MITYYYLNSDGVGRTGTFIMIDMILNKIMKEAKEIDLAATLEYLRDQRVEMVKDKVTSTISNNINKLFFKSNYYYIESV